MKNFAKWLSILVASKVERLLKTFEKMYGNFQIINYVWSILISSGNSNCLIHGETENLIKEKLFFLEKFAIVSILGKIMKILSVLKLFLNCAYKIYRIVQGSKFFIYSNQNKTS